MDIRTIISTKIIYQYFINPTDWPYNTIRILNTYLTSVTCLLEINPGTLLSTNTFFFEYEKFTKYAFDKINFY